MGITLLSMSAQLDLNTEEKKIWYIYILLLEKKLFGDIKATFNKIP